MRIGRILIVVLILILFGSAVFYLFIFPFLVASGLQKLTVTSLVFATLLYLQALILAVEFMYMTISNLYGFKRRTFFFTAILFGFVNEKRIFEKKLSPKGIFLSMFLSYTLIIYLYSIAYLYLANFFKGTFLEDKIGFIDTLYLSFTTISVGPTGLSPMSILAKLMIMSEILIGLIYTVMVFSVIASLVISKEHER